MRAFHALIIALSLNLTSMAIAQPDEVSRVLRNFDFEERRLGNAEDLPMHWSKVDGSGLPHYVNGQLSTDRARSGQYSFRFDLNGGSLIYRYDAGQIRVQPGAHYRVEGFTQTTPLVNARARITAYFIDQDDRPMTSTIRHSEAIASKPSDASWHKLGVELSAAAEPSDRTQAQPVPTSLVVELELLQPMHYAPNSLGQRTLFTQDIRGSAWFDDVTVSQVPKVSLSTDRPGNIFGRSDPLLLKVLVNDRFTDDLAAQLVITDAAGKQVFQRSGALDMTSAQTLGPGRKRMSLTLPDLKPGWYEAALVMSSKGAYVGQHTLDLVLLADDAGPAWPDPRFGIVATDLPFEGWSDLPEILSILAAGRVKLGVWSDAGDVQQIDSPGFDLLLERLGEKRIDPTACLISLPPEIVQKLRRRTIIDSLADALPVDQSASATWPEILTGDKQFWQPQLSYMIARHATHLRRWQIGADDSDNFVTNPQMRQVYTRVYDEFAQLVEHPDLAMPWPAWYELEPQSPATIALHLKPEILPAQVPLYIKDIQGSPSVGSSGNAVKPPAGGAPSVSVLLDPLDSDQYGREVQIRDLAQRIIYALSADAKRIDLRLPFTVTRTGGDPDGNNQSQSDVEEPGIVKQPKEMLMIVRTVMRMLGDATFKGKVPIAEGVEAFLFDRNGQGILVLWDRGMSGSVKQLAINLGQHPQRVDLWGNVTPLLQNPAARSSASESSNVKLDVGPMPFFLVDIDGQLAQLRASVAVDNPLLESSFKPHSRKVRFTNPYRQAISGSFKLVAPAGWVINPPASNFSLNPGETFEKDITVEFPYNSFAGPKTINAEFQVQAETNSTFTAPLILKLGLSDVGLQTLALRDGDDVIVQQMITNYGEKPIDYTAFAIYPGQPRQEKLVTNLGAGRTTVKKYKFTKLQMSSQTKVRSGLKELNGTRILNEEVLIQ